MKPSSIICIFIVFIITTAGCNVSVNKSIRIKDGETVRRSLNTVNGKIIIGNECDVRGNCRSVNGRIEIGRNSRIQSLESVNGRIEIGSHVTVQGSIRSVNGNITCQAPVEIEGSITAVNGSVELNRGSVEGDITTHNGDISLLDHSRVRESIIIKHSNGLSDRRLKITIADDSLVEGDIIVEDDDIEVTVYLQRGGRVEGEIENAKVVEE
ncbi:hypothetical protein JXJ21_15550 [candidate division KSB1 bacterium]|nr:hypothetical protein [candidate division KSB1 bacterium]